LLLTRKKQLSSERNDIVRQHSLRRLSHKRLFTDVNDNLGGEMSQFRLVLRKIVSENTVLLLFIDVNKHISGEMSQFRLALR
jgi:hypothetical protein